METTSLIIKILNPADGCRKKHQSRFPRVSQKKKLLTTPINTLLLPAKNHPSIHLRYNTNEIESLITFCSSQTPPPCSSGVEIKTSSRVAAETRGKQARISRWRRQPDKCCCCCHQVQFNRSSLPSGWPRPTFNSKNSKLLAIPAAISLQFFVGKTNFLNSCDELGNYGGV